MGIEIERKYLLTSDEWKKSVSSQEHIVQGYLVGTSELAVRVRIVDNSIGYMTIKSGSTGISRREIEFPIPLEEAKETLEMCGQHIVEKTRYIVNASNDLKWEIDVFEGRHDGMIVAEIELPSEDAEYDLPDWIGQDVSHDKKYINAYLAFN